MLDFVRRVVEVNGLADGTTAYLLEAVPGLDQQAVRERRQAVLAEAA
jgi:hypothetical protein